VCTWDNQFHIHNTFLGVSDHPLTSIVIFKKQIYCYKNRRNQFWTFGTGCRTFYELPTKDRPKTHRLPSREKTKCHKQNIMIRPPLNGTQKPDPEFKRSETIRPWSEISQKILNVIRNRDGGDQLDRSCKK